MLRSDMRLERRLGAAAVASELRSIAYCFHCLFDQQSGGHQLPVVVRCCGTTCDHNLAGVYWGSYSQHNPRVFRKSLDEVARLFANGDITVHISYRWVLAARRYAYDYCSVWCFGKGLWRPSYWGVGGLHTPVAGFQQPAVCMCLVVATVRISTGGRRPGAVLPCEHMQKYPRFASS